MRPDERKRSAKIDRTLELQGIDNFAQVKRADRNWEGNREFFVVRINELQKMISTEPETSDDKEAAVPDRLLQRPPGTNRSQGEIYTTHK